MVECRRTFVWAAGLLAGLLSGLVAPPRAAADYLPGVDVSHYQGTINWSAVAQSGVTFAFAKATEGTGYTDPYLNANVAGMQANGIIPGLYHFGHPGTDATTQANHFTDAVKAANGGTFSGLLQLVLDLEVTDGKTPAQVWAWTQTFIARVKTLTGRPGIIYTGYYFWKDNVGNPNDNLNCPLWLAAYVSNPDNYVPQAWSGVGWAFWQYTSTGRCRGISGNVDRDVFKNGGSYPNIYALVIP
jgi:GH25 family lysozyme M1 (1,4-beta-N-acetylmuramidase)